MVAAVVFAERQSRAVPVYAHLAHATRRETARRARLVQTGVARAVQRHVVCFVWC